MQSQSPIPFARFSEELNAVYSTRAKATRGKMRQVLDELASLPGVRSTADLTPTMLARFIGNRQDGNANTLVGLLGYVKAACNYAVDRNYLDRSPFLGRRRLVRPVPSTRRTWHSIEDVARVLAHLEAGSGTWAGGRLYCLAAILAYCGLRKNEALHLKAADVDLVRRVISVLPTASHRLKTAGSAAPVPIPDELAVVLRGWLPRCGSEWLIPTLGRDKPWRNGETGRKPLDLLKAAGLAVGVPGLTAQSLRHSCATALEAQGYGQAMIQRVLRHSNQSTQAHYRHAEMKNLVPRLAGFSYRAIGQVPAPAPAPAPLLPTPWSQPAGPDCRPLAPWEVHAVFACATL